MSTAKLVLLLAGCFTLVVAKFGLFVDWPAGLGIVGKAIYLNRFVADFLLFTAVIVLFAGPKFLFRLQSVLALVFFSSVYFIQLHAYENSESFLPVIALENLDHAEFALSDSLLINAVVWLVFVVGLIGFLVKGTRKWPKFSVRVTACSFLLVLAVFAKNDKSWVSSEIQKQRFQFYNSGQAGIPRVSPISSLIRTVEEFRQYSEKQKRFTLISTDLSERAAAFAYDFHSGLGKIDQEYPLIKQQAFSNKPIPFMVDQQISARPKNLIVFFLEGISAGLIQPYSDRFPRLTPNIQHFSENSIRIDNYFSHSYATYRGLGGQLCSIYPLGRLFESTNYYCLAHALQDNGYHTKFIYSQRNTRTDLDTVFKASGFDEIDGFEQLSPLLGTSDDSSEIHLTDAQLFDGLILRMKELDNKFNPYMLGVYNIQTHMGFKLMGNEQPYRRDGRPDSDILSNVHNLDRVFGKFWDYFRKSNHYQDTVVIVTSDHATYPSREYNELMYGSKFSTLAFAGEIPLLIYYPGAESGVSVDARQATSINFTPSILHLLGIEIERAPFVGKSIFLDENRFPSVIAASDTRAWYRDKRGAFWYLKERNKEEIALRSEEAVAQFEFISYLHGLEQSNRLWKRDEN